MPTNLFAPTGLVWARMRSGGAPTGQARHYKIKAGYATKIAVGDLVSTGTGGNQGYITLTPNQPDAANTILGVFKTVLGYFDTNQQAQAYGLNGSWPGSAAAAQNDVDCLVYDDPQTIYRIQVSGGPFVQSWRGNNIQMLTGTNGVPNASGYSTLAADGSTVAVTATLPFRIEDVAGVAGGPKDPGNTNPWIEVSLNFGFPEQQNALGI